MTIEEEADMAVIHFKKVFGKEKWHILFLLLILFSCQHEGKQETNIKLLPYPHLLSRSSGELNLATGYNIETSEQSLKHIIPIIAEDLSALSNGKLIPSPNGAKISLRLNSALDLEAYKLTISDHIIIEGKSKQAIHNGLSTLYQLIAPNTSLPRLEIRDHPDLAYRSLMIDCARSYHNVSTLESMVKLCQWYKIKYLHLHLTDDQLFTFPSESFPELVSQEHYSKSDLIHLNEYASNRGVTLIPEIDMPGHASPFIRKLPEVFGLVDASVNPYTINIGSEKAYLAIEKIIEEMAILFPHSPYIHIGGDEAFFEGIEDDPLAIGYMQKHGIPSVQELFRHFLVRLNTMVKAQGKQMIIWTGFNPEGEIEIPKDIVLIAWEPQYYDPKRIQEAGYQMINASWKPLYVVNNRKWEPEYIYSQWNPRRWESWTSKSDQFIGIELESNKNLLGATMCAWEQKAINELSRLRRRIPAMSQNLWNERQKEEVDFKKVFDKIDKKLSRFIRPFAVRLTHKKYPDLEEGNYNDHLEFYDSLILKPLVERSNISLHYSLNGENVALTSHELEDELIIKKDAKINIQAFNISGEKMGLPYQNNFYHSPITATKTGLEKIQPPNSWEKMRYEEDLTIELSSSIANKIIKYSLEGGKLDENSLTYSGPLKASGITHLTAQLFDSISNEKIGTPLSETYYNVDKMPSLTTGKPVIASNEKLRPGLAEYAIDGRVTLWEQWGDHLDGNNWVQVDLEKVYEISRLTVVNFWDNYRYYQYKLFTSVDGEDWKEIVDFTDNKELSTPEGYHHKIEATKARYIKILLTYNSANPGLHLIEIAAWE